jgi:hypothetical protein
VQSPASVNWIKLFCMVCYINHNILYDYNNNNLITIQNGMCDTIFLLYQSGQDNYISVHPVLSFSFELLASVV